MLISQARKGSETGNQRPWLGCCRSQETSAVSATCTAEQRLLVAAGETERSKLLGWHRRRFLWQNSKASSEPEASLCRWLQLRPVRSHAEPLVTPPSRLQGCRSLPANHAISSWDIYTLHTTMVEQNYQPPLYWVSTINLKLMERNYQPPFKCPSIRLPNDYCVTFVTTFMASPQTQLRWTKC